MSHPFAAAGSAHRRISSPLTTSPLTMEGVNQTDSGNSNNSHNNNHVLQLTINMSDSSRSIQRQEIPPAYSPSGRTSVPEIEAEGRQRDGPKSALSPNLPPARTSLISQDPHRQSRRGHSVRFQSPFVGTRDSDEYVPRDAVDIACSYRVLTPESLKLPSSTKKHIKYFMKAPLSDIEEGLICFWAPRPYSRYPLHCEEKAISIGDVGIFGGKFGHLETKFNIFLSRNENRERGYRPPDDFIPYADSLKDQYLSENASEMTKAVMGVSGGWKKRRVLTADQMSQHVLFSVERQSLVSPGSALVLPEGFIKIGLSVNRQNWVHKYILEQGKSWYDGDQPQPDALDPGKKPRALEDGSLVIVIGCCVAPTWAVASNKGVVTFASETYADLKKKSPEVDLYVWHAGNAKSASGPGVQDLEDGKKAVHFNQCVGVEAYTIHKERPNISRSTWNIRAMVSSARSVRTVS